MAITYSRDEVYSATLAYFNGDTLATDVFINKYALRDLNDNYYELTPLDMHKRMAKEFARIEALYPNAMSYEEILHLMSDWSCDPQGSPMSALGNPFQVQSASNCFLIESPYDSIGGILQADQHFAQLSKRRAGVGCDISTLRPAGAQISNAARSAVGIGLWMERYSATTREIGQNGRRAATMLTLSVHHPDVLDFINIKKDLVKVTGANVSLRLSDEFLIAVKENKQYQLRFPVDEKIAPLFEKWIDAKVVWDAIIDAAWTMAEPGIMFWDNITKNTPTDLYGEYGFTTRGCNPCNEINLSPYDSCRLIALNLYNFVEQPFTSGAYFNYTKFAQYAYKAQKLMDDLVDIELEHIDKILAKIALDPEPAEIKAVELNLWQKIRHFCQLGRRTGLGILALGDALAACNIKYGSPESIAMTEEIYRILALNAYRATVDMAEERGAFAICDPVREEAHPFLARIMAQDPALREKWMRVGRRNIALLTTAPTGSLATQTQTTSGCESLFAMYFTRRRKINPTDKSAKVHFVDALGDSWEEYKVFHPKLKEWMRITGKTEDQINESPYAGATANEIDWIAAVDMQAVAQKWVCHSISRTINLPKDVSRETVAQIYQRAWESGVKGITVYRDGCRSGVLITDESANATAKSKGRPTKIMPTSAPVRPVALDCILYHVKVKGEPFVVIVGTLEGQPYEIFSGTNREIKFPKNGTKGQVVRTKQKQDGNAIYDLQYVEESETKVISNIADKLDNGIYGAFTRTLSASLRHGIPLQFLIDQLKKDKNSDITSFSSAIARVLQKHYAPESEKKQKCTNCNSESLQVQEGCLICMNCGSSKCS